MTIFKEHEAQNIRFLGARKTRILEQMYRSHPPLFNRFSKYSSPLCERSIFKGIPNTLYNRELISKLFKRLKATYPHTYRNIILRIRYRGPRPGYMAANCLQEDATSFAVYEYIDWEKQNKEMHG